MTTEFKVLSDLTHCRNALQHEIEQEVEDGTSTRHMNNLIKIRKKIEEVLETLRPKGLLG